MSLRKEKVPDTFVVIEAPDRSHGHSLATACGHARPEPQPLLPPDIKQHRVPAPGISFAQPNLPILIQDITRQMLPSERVGEERHPQGKT